jgi:hypothetical protein
MGTAQTQEPVDERPEVVAALAKRMETSLEGASRALSAFAENLERSGFAAAAPQYRELQAVLLQQRLWSARHARTELEPRWRDVADRAARVHALLAPLAGVMSALATLPTLTAEEDPAPKLPARKRAAPKRAAPKKAGGKKRGRGTEGTRAS